MSSNTLDYMSGKRLTGKVIIVTGASSGIGKSTALLLADHGAKLGLLDMNTPTATEEEIKSKGGQSIAIQCNVTSPEQVAKATKTVVDKYGPLNGAANLAGVMTKGTTGGAYSKNATGSLRDMDDDVEWDRMISVNLGGVKNCMREQLRHVSPDGLSIVNAASVAGTGPSPYNAAYGASKAAVISLSMSVAHEAGRDGARVNAIAPGLVATPLVDHLSNDTMNQMASRYALGRASQAEEIANLILFLLSDEASYCTGSVFTIDGGRR